MLGWRKTAGGEQGREKQQAFGRKIWTALDDYRKVFRKSGSLRRKVLSSCQGEADSKLALFYIEFITEKLLAYEETRAQRIKSTAIILLSAAAAAFLLKIKTLSLQVYLLPATYAETWEIL